MAITGIISAIVVGLIIGALGRLVVPGKQHIPIWLTLLIGIIAALVGSWIASFFTSFWLVILIVQVVLAAIVVYAVAGMWSARGRRV
ncbi:GlsB/YeaQ/YmgE family stress response membrane protein [Marinactinospora rubrisoli]|uniref:GlsB/YeaQ/YmgE family stress response membrane protein n=1 Tax=Marinactinospora rubrisoli TaxID=2715399 RepID=A0ABW2KDR3_9ACTN